jgi:tetratricopeptide (TPR) repeat protein
VFHESMLSGEESIDQLREACSSAPEDLENRARLLGALSALHRSEPAPELVSEVVWWIRHHPREVEHVMGALSMLSHAPFWAHQRIRDAWEAALATHGEATEVALAAAESFSHHEPDRALALLERAHAASKDPRPARKAGHIWWLRSLRFHRSGEPEHAREEATEALRWFENALERERGASQRLVTLPDACKAALAVGEPERARALAEEMLSRTASAPVDWDTGNAIYGAHSILGEIALREGAIDRAKDHLRLAGLTPGSPQLDSFGPDLRLADALLQRGERSAVVAFLREIGRFWQDGRSRIELWCLEIERGDTPKLSRFED